MAKMMMITVKSAHPTEIIGTAPKASSLPRSLPLQAAAAVAAAQNASRTVITGTVLPASHRQLPLPQLEVTTTTTARSALHTETTGTAPRASTRPPLRPRRKHRRAPGLVYPMTTTGIVPPVYLSRQLSLPHPQPPLRRLG
jgi:hypothetical protein